MVHTNVAFDTLADDVALIAGTTLCDGQFTLTHQIGAGGFGLTYKAEDNMLGRTVVIKECFPEDFCMRQGVNVVPRNQQHAQQFQSIVAMFMREARSLAKLRHPNIVGVHRAFEENNTAYMVLDLIEGEDLLDILEKSGKSLTPEIVQDLLLKLLDAVEKVHDMDLLHRDIAPDNIMIDKAGTPVLIDFGAARGDASRKTRMISSLLVVKDGYSPQEFYVAGSLQSPSSDLFALGATFYHLLTGAAPMNSQARMIEIAGNKEDPCLPLTKRIKGYPHAFLDAIDRAMKILPSDRLQSAAEWRNLINGAPNGAAKTSQPRLSPSAVSKPVVADLGKTLTRLIEETNVVVSEALVVQDKPAVVKAPEPVQKVPAWVAEFNKESLGDADQPKDAPRTPADAPARAINRVRSHPSRPTQPKHIKTRVLEPTSRPTGWALEAIQARDSSQHEQAKAHTRQQSASNPAQAAEPSRELLLDEPVDFPKQLVRMGLMGAFFGILVYIGATAAMGGI